MILRRRSLFPLTSLVLLLTGAVIGRAESVETKAASAGEEHVAAPEPGTPRPPETAAEPTADRGAVAPEPGHSTEAAPKAEPATTEPAAKTDSPTPIPSGQTVEEAHREIVGLQNLGISLSQRSDWDAAEIAFRQILKSPRANAGDLANALLGLARVYRRQGSLTKAAAIYERYLKDYPAAAYVPDALLELGRTQRAMGAPQLALARFYNVINSTLKLSSENSDHYQVLAKTAQFEIAETHFQQGNFAEANKFFSRLRLLDLAPADRARAHFKSADALFRDKDFDGAVKTLTSFLEQSPQDENVPEARYLLSVSLRALGRKQEALDATLALLRNEKPTADPKRWSYWQRRTGNQLANDFFQNGDTMNALMIYQNLATLSLEPDWRLPITYQMALCYERMRQYDRAASAYQSIIDNGKTPAATDAPGEASTKGSEPAKAPSAELTELSRMAAWRIRQLNWHEQTEHQLATLFTPVGEATPKVPESPHALVPNIDTNVSSQPTPEHPPGNDHSGNPAKTSASL